MKNEFEIKILALCSKIREARKEAIIVDLNKKFFHPWGWHTTDYDRKEALADYILEREDNYLKDKT